MPTNYTISTYKKLGIIEPLDLAKLPNFDGATEDPRFTAEGTIDGKTYAVPKNWGTTGFAVNTKQADQADDDAGRSSSTSPWPRATAAPWCTTTS